jgi:hypothetical protein
MIYELRTYTVKPESLPQLMALWGSEGAPLIEEHLPCVGVWTSESGVLNKVYHLYAWESYEARESARKRFYENKAAQQYVAKVKPLYVQQESNIMSPTKFSPCSKFIRSPK